MIKVHRILYVLSAVALLAFSAFSETLSERIGGGARWSDGAGQEIPVTGCGDYLWLDSLRKKPGFVGAHRFLNAVEGAVHEVDYPVRIFHEGLEIPWEYETHAWYPEFTSITYRTPILPLTLVEKKWTSPENVFMDLFEISSEGDSEIPLRVELGRTRPYRPFTVIALGGGGRDFLAASYPHSIRIPIGKPAERLHFLGHVGEFCHREGTPSHRPVARYRILFEDNQEEVVNLFDGVHFGTFETSYPSIEMDGELRFGDKRAYRFSWSVPSEKQGTAIRWISFEKAGEQYIPLLFAVTIEAESLYEPVNIADIANVHPLRPSLTHRGQYRERFPYLPGRNTVNGVPFDLADHTSFNMDQPFEPIIEFRGYRAYEAAGLRVEEQRTSDRLFVDVSIPSGGRVGGTAAVALSPDPDADSKISRALADVDPLPAYRAKYEEWFARNAPRLRCASEEYERMWDYRWFLTRFNQIDLPLQGEMRHAFLEGRRRYSSVISFSVPMQLLEVRWLRDPSYARDHMLHAIGTQSPEGLYNWRSLARDGYFYTNFIPAAAWRVYEVNADREWLESILPSCELNLSAWLDMGPDGPNRRGDYLPECFDAILGGHAGRGHPIHGHVHTGMEFQPAWWYFTGDPDQILVSMKRVDVAAYQAANALAVSRMHGELGRPFEAVHFRAISEEIRRAIETRMWDPITRFFYSLHPISLQKAMVREIVGFFPHALRVVGRNYGEVFEYLVDPAHFMAPWPVPTVARSEPFYNPQDMPCRWDGPTWPYGNSMVLEALGYAAQEYSPELTPVFHHLFHRYTLLQFQEQDLSRPLVVEEYNPETGVPNDYGDIFDYQLITDYFHSWYNSLFIEYIAGLRPNSQKDVLDLKPLCEGFPAFEISGLRYQNRDIRISWAPTENTPESYEPGYRVYVDGEEVVNLPKPEAVFLQ